MNKKKSYIYLLPLITLAQSTSPLYTKEVKASTITSTKFVGLSHLFKLFHNSS